jgi:hypothetical protein
MSKNESTKFTFLAEVSRHRSIAAVICTPVDAVTAVNFKGFYADSEFAGREVAEDDEVIIRTGIPDHVLI